MKKVFVYIDGQNFYHGLKDYKLDGKSFNFRTFAEELCARKTLVAIKYFGAKYPSSESLQRHNADDAFFKTLTEKLKIQVIEGRFQVLELKSRTGKITRRLPREKGVDVRLATELIIDAFHDVYDEAYVLSSDTDLIPAIKEVKKKFSDKKVVNFAFRRLREFQEECDSCYKIYRNKAKKHVDHTAFMPTEKTLIDLQNKYNGSR